MDPKFMLGIAKGIILGMILIRILNRPKKYK